MSARRSRDVRKYPAGPPTLTARMKRMASLLVYGHPADGTCTRYTLADAARSVGYQAKAGRALWNTSKLFRDEVERLVLDKVRGGEADESATIPDDPHELLALIGEEAAPHRDRVPVKPGYIIRLPEGMSRATSTEGAAPGYVIDLSEPA